MLLSTLAALPFPDIDPIIFQIGPLAIRWYALAYIAGLMLGWKYVVRLVRHDGDKAALSEVQVDDFLVWATIGVVLGGRLGYVLFYRPGFYLDNPAEIIAVWQGGMSFHGGLLGVTVAMILYSRKYGLKLLGVTDLISMAAPIGLFFGRLANFINGELWGRTSDVAWAMAFPHGGTVPRHPSQIYEALLEGAVLFLILWLLRHRTDKVALPGFLTGVFIGGYGLARFIVEFFREPDAHLGFLFAGATMGQLLSLPLILLGVYLLVRAQKTRD
jgi:phosphatidylglycerol---prolipoprotein diacylglyceryl transferase